MLSQQINAVIEEQVNSIYSEISAIHQKAESKDIDLFIDKIKMLEEILRGKSIFILLDHSKLSPLYVSENGDSMGYKRERVLNGGLRFALKIIDFRQVYAARHLIKWGRDFNNLIGNNRILNSYAYICGLAFKDKQRNRRVFLLKQTSLRVDKNKEICLSLLQADEITEIYKSKSYWVQYCCDTGYTPITRFNFSNNPGKEFHRLFTKRELEILKLAAQQKKNIEIGEELNISINTVERHRKNMISKVGVIDMTALITIAKMIGAI